MISAFDVYLVMQLDSIKDAIAAIMVALFCLVFAQVLFLIIEEVYSKALLILSSLLLVASITAFSFIPSSKTAAAMMIIPKLTSLEAIETVNPEVKELYDLAKGALRGVVEKNVEKEK
jgi:hypothetical protein